MESSAHSREPVTTTAPTTPLLPNSAVHPFRYNARLHSGVLQLIKMILVGLILFIPRLLCIIFGFATLAISASLRVCCNTQAVDDEGRPMPVRGGAVSMLFMRIGSRLILFGFGYWWISFDDQRVDKKETAPIIAGNHVSFLEAFYFAYACAPMGVGKAELYKAPILGSVAKATQMIGVSREDAGKAHNAASEIKRRARWSIDNTAAALADLGTFPPILIFPEATCTNTTSVIQFKLGAFAPMVPVQPVAIDVRQNHLDASWVDRMPPYMTALRMMCQVYNRMSVTYLPIVRPGTPQTETPAQLAAVTRRAIATRLGVPTTEHNFLDVLLAREVSKLRLPRASINVEMGQFEGEKGALARVKAELQRFAGADVNKDGCLDEAEFATLLGFDTEAARIAHGTLISAAFQHWDRDGDGKVNFRDYLLLSSAMHVSRLAQKYQFAMSRNDSAVAVPSDPLTEGDDGDSPSLAAAGGVRMAEYGRVSVSQVLQQHAQPGARHAAAAGGDRGGAPDGLMTDELRGAFALAFAAFDSDSDGFVAEPDFIRVLEATAPSVSISEARALFRYAASQPTSPKQDDAPAPAETGRVSMSQFLDVCERFPVLVASLLDAIVAVDVARALTSDGGTAPRQSSPTSATDSATPELAAISRHNSFVEAQ